MSEFVVKDSGQRQEFASGMRRDTTEGKVDYTLVLRGPMFKRWAKQLMLGALKYGKNNWLKAKGDEELQRFRESALRHFLQWFWGDTDEDHAAAVFFNINGAEYVKEQMVKCNCGPQECCSNCPPAGPTLPLPSTEAAARALDKEYWARLQRAREAWTPEPAPIRGGVESEWERHVKGAELQVPNNQLRFGRPMNPGGQE